MKKDSSLPPKKKRGWKVILVILLAVSCIGCAELAASYFFAPAFFEAVTSPVIAGAKKFSSACRQTAIDFSLRLDETAAQLKQNVNDWKYELAAEKTRLEEAQLAAEALLKSNNVIASPSITEFRKVNGTTILTGGVVPLVYFNQGDPAWADLPYGGRDTIGDYACGPTVLAMAVSSLTAYERSPVQMAQWAVENHYWAPRSGSNYSIVSGVSDFGLQCTPILNRTPETLQDVLLSGDLIVALMGPGHFTRGGHFILLHGITLSGSILVADPNSEERSLMEWDPQLIIDELSRSRGSGAPLWAISRPDA